MLSFSAESNLVVPDDDEFCKKFLRPCKWYPKSSFELVSKLYSIDCIKIYQPDRPENSDTNVTREILISQLKRYYKFKLNNPRFCLDLLPTNEQKVLISEIAIPLPERTADGCRVILFNTGKQWNPKIITGDEIFRATILLMEATAIEAKTQVKVSSLSIFNLWNFYQNMSRTET